MKHFPRNLMIFLAILTATFFPISFFLSSTSGILADKSKFMGLLKAYPATTDSNSDFKSYWAGQSASLLKHRDTKVLFDSLVSEMNKM